MLFAYNASALGAGGIIERGNVITTIPSLASVALAPTGGEGRSVVSNYVSQELSFAHAETRVYGRRFTDKNGDASFTTSTYVLMKDVNIFDRVTIGEMGSTVTSTRGLNGGEDHDFEISLWYDDVRIDGKKRGPRIDARLRELKRYEDLPKLLAERTAAAGGEGRSLAERFNGTTDEIVKLVSEKKPVQGSIVEGLEQEESAAVTARQLLPPTIYVERLGTVYFGEFMLKPGRRRLNLLRVQFGPRVDTPMPRARIMAAERPMDDSDDSGTGGVTGGSMTLGSGEGNGTPIGP
jgi:hypothetical protein